MNPLMFHGYKVVANPILTKTETREVKRTWKERLFTRPWQPLKVMRTESYQVPDHGVVVDRRNRVIHAHPVVVKEIEAAIEKQERVSRMEMTYPFTATTRVNPLWGGPIT